MSQPITADTPKYPLPTEEDIRETIAHLKRRLKDNRATKPNNKPVKQGYDMAITILAEGRRTYDGIKDLTYLQSRAIAELAVDYLNGEHDQAGLINVPLK